MIFDIIKKKPSLLYFTLRCFTFYIITFKTSHKLKSHNVKCKTLNNKTFNYLINDFIYKLKDYKTVTGGVQDKNLEMIWILEKQLKYGISLFEYKIRPIIIQFF